MTDWLVGPELITSEVVLGVGPELDGGQQHLPLIRLSHQDRLVFRVGGVNVRNFYQSAVRKISLDHRLCVKTWWVTAYFEVMSVQDDLSGSPPESQSEDGPLRARHLQYPRLVGHEDGRPVQPPCGLPAVPHVDGGLRLDHVPRVAVVSVTVAEADPAQPGGDQVQLAGGRHHTQGGDGHTVHSQPSYSAVREDVESHVSERTLP